MRISDWSSDVYSSDLLGIEPAGRPLPHADGLQAEPKEIGPAEEPEDVEDHDADDPGPNAGDQRERRPDDVADEMAAEKAGARHASLAGADPEQGPEGWSRRERVGRPGPARSQRDRCVHDVPPPPEIGRAHV